jgi:RNA polymerase sigma-70 factor, ECF subfamily
VTVSTVDLKYWTVLDRATPYARIRGLSPQTAAGMWTDVALLDRIVARDSTALAELYDRHSRLLYGLVLRILKNRDEAEEVLQDVFIQVWTRVSTYRRELASPTGWLVGIARNRAIDRLRANAIRLRARETSSDAPAGGRPEGQISRGTPNIDVQRALETLSPEQRDLIEQAYFFGLTHVELSERHGLPLGTVKTRIRTAVLALRAYLERTVIGQ